MQSHRIENLKLSGNGSVTDVARVNNMIYSTIIFDEGLVKQYLRIREGTNTDCPRRVHGAISAEAPSVA